MRRNVLIALALAGSCLATQVAQAAVLPQLDPVLLDTTYVSTSGSTPAAIDFDNLLGYAVDVYWIDYSGDRVFYRTIAAYSSYVQSTYITHPWIIAKFGSGDTTTQGSGTLITGFLAETPSSLDLAPDIADIGAVPEPASWALMLVGFGALGAMLRRRKAVRVRFT